MEIDRRGSNQTQPPKSIRWQMAIMYNDHTCRACRCGWTDGVERAGKNSVILVVHDAQATGGLGLHGKTGMMRKLKARVIAHYKANHPEITVS